MDTAYIRYTGKFENGEVFDSNQSKEGLEVKVGQGKVIQGWEDALLKMRKGMKAKVTIPPELAYGKAGNSKIPPNSTLIFDMEVASVSPS